MPYCAYDECGSETPTCAYAHITRPEQSKPPGAEPAQTYGVLSCDIAYCTTLPCVGGGATTVSADGVIAEAPTTVVEACCIADACNSRKRSLAAAASARWCAACSAT